MVGIERAQEGGGNDALAVHAKRASDAVGRRALANEATVLGRLAHPGVIRLVAYTETERHAQLVTELAPGSSLAELGFDSPTAVAAVGAAAAAVVADLHGLGLAHGSLTPEHLIVSDGRVVLCSFGRAAEAAPAAMDRDVADLVVALTDAAARLPEPPTRVERRRRRRLDELLVGAASRSMSASELGAALARLAVEADSGIAHAGTPRGAAVTGGEPAVAVPSVATTDALPAGAPEGPRRPTPERAARPWRERVVRAGPSDAAATSTTPWRRRRNVAVGACAGLMVVALWAVLAPDQRATTAAPSPASDAPSPPAPPPPATPTPSPAPLPPTVATPHVVVVGNLVAVDSDWYEVGTSGDVVRVGDWDCDGFPSPAVLRPSTGEVFVFNDLASGDVTRRADALTVVPDATDLAAVPSQGCDALMVLDDAGHESVVEVTS